MGKTSLLRRIGMGVRDNPQLAAKLLPLSFREEQYNVHTLHAFWCNCLDALGGLVRGERTARPLGKNRPRGCRVGRQDR